MTLLASGIVTLTSGRATCQVAPLAGGAIAAFWWEENGRRIDWLRRTPPAAVAAGDPARLAAFPVLPYGGRSRGGRFVFAGREVIEPDPLPRGQGGRRAWTVVQRREDCLLLEYEHAPGAWPWRYRARQVVALEAGTLSLTLELENLSEELMPAGLGYLPFFPRTPDTIVTAAASDVWLSDDQLFPKAKVAIPPDWDLAGGRRVAELALNNVFAGWDGAALVTWPERQARLRLEATQPLFSFLDVSTRAPGEDFRLAPLSHCTDAINLARAGEAGTGLRVLAPGARRSGSITLRPDWA